ncbi:hypothetical protein ABNQ38_01360 [Azospirillum sp. A29]|uniref:hypothetical protein n=1 Tax=Azospirillum sp. A29 TaxID=3160606 RepID=UPI00366ACA28
MAAATTISPRRGVAPANRGKEGSSKPADHRIAGIAAARIAIWLRAESSEIRIAEKGESAALIP